MQKEASVKAPKSPAKSTAFSIDSVNGSKPLAEAASCLEFLLVSFCQHFALKPKQAAGLLTQDGKYLAYILSRGLKGKHDAILGWYQAINGSYQVLLTLIQKEETSGSVSFVLHALQGGLRSRSLETAQWTCRVLVRLGQELQNQGLLRPAWEVTATQWFIEEGLEACLAACGRYGPEIKGQVVTLLVQFGHGNFLEMFTVQLRNHLNPTSAYLVTMSEFLPALCELRTGKQELLSEGVVDYWLDRGLKEWAEQKSSPDLRSAALTLMCEIWIRFPGKVEAQDKQAADILTALKRAARDSKSNLVQFGTIAKMFGLLDHFSLDRSAYAPILYKSLTFALVENYEKNLVREFILDNFARTFASEPEMPVGILLDPYLKQLQVADVSICNLADLNFFLVVCKHPRLNLKNAVQVLDVLAKYALATEIYERLVRQMVQIVGKRYGEMGAMQEFLYQLVKQIIDGMEEEEVQGSVTKTRLVQTVIQIAEADLRTRITKYLISANKDHLKQTGRSHPSLLPLLSPLVDVKKLGVDIADSEPNRSFKRSQEASPPKRAPLAQPRMRVLVQLEQSKARREQVKAKVSAVKPPEQDKKQRTFKRQFELKRISTDSSFRAASMDPPKHTFAFDLQEESEEDREGVWAIMKKYTRVLRLLFQKYSSSGYRPKDSTTFDQQAERLALITEPETLKLLKDQAVAPRFVSKEVLSTLFRKRQGLDFESYQELMIQVAVFAFSKPPKDLSVYPPAVSVNAFFDLLRSASADKGLPLRLFDEPDPGAGDRDLCRKLNQTLQTNPNADLPEGYRKVTEYNLHVNYAIPRTVRIPRSHKIALTVLDDILSEQLGVHILEPQFRFKQVVHAQGVLVKQAKLPLPVVMNAEIKYQASLLTKDYSADLLVECAQALDDLVYSVEKGSSSMLSRKHNRAVSNQVLREREAKEREVEELKAKAERRRQLRRQVVEETLQMGKKAQEKQKRRERRKARRTEKEQLQVLQQREEERRQLRESKEREMRAWYQQKQAQEQAELAHAALLKQQDAGTKSRLRQDFLRKQKQQLSSFAQEMAQKRLQSRERESEEMHREEETRALQKQQALKAVQQHRRQRDFSQSLRTNLQEAVNQPDVQTLLFDFNKSLEVLFTHYSKATARLDRDPLLAVSALRLPGFKRLCLQVGVVPGLLGTEEVVVVFTRLAKSEKGVEGVLALTIDSFRQAIAELAVLARPALKQARGEPPPTTAFAQKDLKDFFDHLAITANPKSTLVLLKRLTDPLNQRRPEGQSIHTESEFQGAKK